MFNNLQNVVITNADQDVWKQIGKVNLNAHNPNPGTPEHLAMVNNLLGDNANKKPIHEATNLGNISQPQWRGHRRYFADAVLYKDEPSRVFPSSPSRPVIGQIEPSHPDARGASHCQLENARRSSTSSIYSTPLFVHRRRGDSRSSACTINTLFTNGWAARRVVFPQGCYATLSLRPSCEIVVDQQLLHRNF